jgi:hypothetical protein
MNVNPQDFLDQTVTGQNSTQRIPVPAAEYPALIDKVEYRQMNLPSQPGEIRHVCDVTYSIDDANVKEITGLPKPTVRQTLWLDLTADGKLDMSKGKNVDLGRLREALGLNDPEKPFSFSQLKGMACFIKVEHNPSKDGKDVFANVASVGRTPS